METGKAAIVIVAMMLTNAAHAQLTRAKGKVVQTSKIGTIVAVAAGAGSQARVATSSIVEGATIRGSVRQTSTGGSRVAIAAGTATSASIVESSICGTVNGDARLVSSVKSATVVGARTGSSARIQIANVGYGSQGPQRRFVAGGHYFATDVIPFVASRISVNSKGGC